LNSWTIKNNYPLPLILDLIDNIEKKEIFTKMDLRWDYDNVRIKKGNEWKAAFSMSDGVFEPMVIFFRLTNLPVTFQVMMNDLLRDMIKVGDIAVFIDDVMVGTETEEEHDDILKEVLKRMVENDLFIKNFHLSVWKVREVGFLGVVIEPDRVKMEKEKMQGVVDWLVLRSVKDMQKFLELANYYKWFVKDFARMAKLFYEMTMKDVK